LEEPTISFIVELFYDNLIDMSFLLTNKSGLGEYSKPQKEAISFLLEYKQKGSNDETLIVKAIQ
jgi:hypothetical protein